MFELPAEAVQPLLPVPALVPRHVMGFLGGTGLLAAAEEREALLLWPAMSRPPSLRTQSGLCLGAGELRTANQSAHGNRSCVSRMHLLLSISLIFIYLLLTGQKQRESREKGR